MENVSFSWRTCTRVPILLAVILAFAAPCNAATCTSTMVDALIEFRTAFNDPRNRLFSNWDDARESDCCTWTGVTCQNEALVVLDLEGPSGTSADRLTPNRSYMAIPGHSLNKLQDLQTLKLVNLPFSSRIPSQWSSFGDSLLALTATNCDLQGSIPSGLASNSRLQTLDLESNNLTGTIPSRLCDLPSLKYLDVSYNDLNTGSVPNCLTSGGSITTVNYGHQSTNSNSYSPYNSGATLLQTNLVVVLVLLPLLQGWACSV